MVSYITFCIIVLNVQLDLKVTKRARYQGFFFLFCPLTTVTNEHANKQTNRQANILIKLFFDDLRLALFLFNACSF